MKKPDSTVVLNFRSCLVNKYLEKGFYIIQKDSEQKSMLPIDVKLRIDLIDQMDTDFFMEKQSNFLRIKHHQKLHIQKNMYLIYKQDFYKDKQK